MSTSLRTTTPGAAVIQVLAIMRSEDVRHLLVVQDGALVGVLSNRDYRRIIERADAAGTIRNVGAVTVAEIMTPATTLIVRPPDTPLDELARLMVTKKIGSVPIVEASGRPVGIVTQKDVLSALIGGDDGRP